MEYEVKMKKVKQEYRYKKEHGNVKVCAFFDFIQSFLSKIC